MIKVLFHGLHEDHLSDDHYVIDPLTSSVTLIRTSKNNILIDSGAFYHKDKLLAELAKEGLAPDDIDYVLNTHYHFDHTANNFLFSDAFVGVGQNLISHKNGQGYVYHSVHNPHFPAEIEDLPTPGHATPHHSYVYRENGLAYVIAGDAISEKRFRKGIFHAPDCEAFYDSAMKIFDIADVIIPGHFDTIEGDQVPELCEIVKKLKP